MKRSSKFHNWQRWVDQGQRKHKITSKDAVERFLAAVRINQVEVARECLAKGVDPNVHTGNTVTALHRAAERGDYSMAELLIEHPNTNVNLVQQYGATALNIAAKLNRIEVVKLLLDHYADPNIPDKFGYTPLHNAILWNREIVFKMLLTYGANVNVFNVYGLTPLNFAANEVPNKNMLLVLLQYNADVNIYHAGRTMPLLLECCLTCRTEQQLEMIEILLQYGAKVDGLSYFTGKTALHIAAFTGYIPLINLLLSYRANKSIKDIKGDTPYDMAMRCGNVEAAEILEESLSNIGFS